MKVNPDLDIERFVDAWVYDIERLLDRRLDELKQLLLSDNDEEARHQADEEVVEILSWKLPPTGTEQQSGRKAGRPRTRGRDAIKALTLRLTTHMTWPEITFQIEQTPCEHFCEFCRDVRRDLGRLNRKELCQLCGSVLRSKKKTVCEQCGDRTENLSSNMKSFLTKRGLAPSLPPKRELEKQCAITDKRKRKN